MKDTQDRLLNNMILTMRWMVEREQKTWRPPTDVYETDSALIVKIEVAGMDERDFTISLSNRNLIITGIRRDLDPKLAYQQLEIPYGHLRTQVFLPYEVDHEAITAAYEKGFLTVTLPKIKTCVVHINPVSTPN